MIKEYKSEVDFEQRFDTTETRKEVANELRNILKKIDNGTEQIIEFYVKVQEDLN